jgi:hypothetical protein
VVSLTPFFSAFEETRMGRQNSTSKEKWNMGSEHHLLMSFFLYSIFEDYYFKISREREEGKLVYIVKIYFLA